MGEWRRRRDLGVRGRGGCRYVFSCTIPLPLVKSLPRAANSTTYAADDAQGRSAPSSEGHDDSKFGGDTRNIVNVTPHQLKRVKEDEEQLAAEEEEEEQRRRRDELG